MNASDPRDLCVIAPFPSVANSKDGMIQRIAHIDGLVSDLPRTYLDLSLTRHWRGNTRTDGLATIHCLNVFVHFFRILAILRAARLVYVHSAHNALRLIPFPTRATVVFDAHGIVPEEMLAEGRRGIARVMATAERFALRRCDVLVCVTRSMLAHFQRKHGNAKGREEIVLPILPHFGEASTAQTALAARRRADAVIYAGGMQSWQNVDKMIAAAKRQPRLDYTFLTGDLERFSTRLKAANVQRFRCESVAPVQVKDYYLDHQFGFVLREPDLVNAVACPTKLVEYLYWGVLPIVITPRIGDFDETSLRGVTLQDFESGTLPDADTAAQMRQHNQNSVLALIASAQTYQATLRDRLHGRP